MLFTVSAWNCSDSVVREENKLLPRLLVNGESLIQYEIYKWKRCTGKIVSLKLSFLEVFVKISWIYIGLCNYIQTATYSYLNHKNVSQMKLNHNLCQIS